MKELIVNVKLDEGAIMPTKAHDADAGFDLYLPTSICNVFVPPRGFAIIDTGVHIEIPEGYVGFIKSKSGLNIYRDLISEGVIDSGYTGSIKVKVRNTGDEPAYFFYGEKVAQIVFLPIPSVTLKQVDKLDDTDRGDNGFGSSGR